MDRGVCHATVLGAAKSLIWLSIHAVMDIGYVWYKILFSEIYFQVSVQSLSHVWLFANPRTTERQASRITSLLELMSIVSDAIQPFHPVSSPSPLAFSLSKHQGLSNESVLYIRWPKYWSFSFSIGPSNEYSGLISFRIKWFDFCCLLQSCPTLCDPIDGSQPGSPVPGILQARTLEWVAISFSNVWKWKVKVKSLSRVQLLATPWTAAYQAPPSKGFSRQEYWSGLPLPSPFAV